MGNDFRKVSVKVFASLIATVLVVFAGSAAVADVGPGKLVEVRANYSDSFTRIAPPPSYYSRMSALDAGANAAGANIIVNYSGFSAQARTAFQFAVDIWASSLSSAVTIEVDAFWTPLGAGILGSAGPTYTIRDWVGCGAPPPVAGTWYHFALANAIAGNDIDTCVGLPAGTADITANFNSAFGMWYFGTDGNPPAGQWDFVTVVLHELCHGLGFSGFADPFTPTMLSGGFPSIYSTFAQNGAGTKLTSLSGASLSNALLGNAFFAGPATVAANGGSRPPLYAPNPWQQGSSFSHFDEATFSPGTNGSLMTPQLNSAEAAHNPGTMVLGLFSDIGWTAAPPADPIVVDLTGNGGDGPLNINKGDNLTLNATITNASGQQGDYFLVAVYKGMFFTYKFASKVFVPGQSATFQGPLINLTAKKIYSSTKLPPGKIIFYLAVDENQNNQVDMGTLAFDKLIVRVD